jgi:colicin import membrane protein
MTRTLGLCLGLCAALVALPGCGGGQKGPKPLKYRLAETDVALVPMSKKEEMLSSQNEFHKARAQHLKAEAELDQARTDLRVARNEQKQAALSEESAKTRRAAAESGNDMNALNEAASGLRAAELARRAADLKIDYYRAYIVFLERFRAFTEENMYAQEARYEEAKARLAVQENIRPRGFEFNRFKEQREERSRAAQRARAVAEQEKKKADDARRRWIATRQEAERAASAPASK